MEHFANFGVVKQQNKELKKLWEANQAANPEKLGYYKPRVFRKLTPEKALPYQKKFLQPLTSSTEKGKRLISTGEGINRRVDRIYEGKPVVERKYKSGELLKERPQPIYEPDSNSFTEIRKTKDKAASPTGYLGYQKDPYKGYGGMMEEPVDMLPTGRKTKPRISY